MRNVRSRHIPVPATVAGAVLDRMADDPDLVWPTPAWPPLRLDRGFAPGSTGGHGPIRYTVTEHRPGVSVRFAFDPRIGAIGHHELRIEPTGPDSCRAVHEIRARTAGRMRIAWPVAVRWLHEAVVDELLGNLHRQCTGTLPAPVVWSPWVRLLRRPATPRPIASTSSAVDDATDGHRMVGAWRQPLPPGMPTDATAWLDALLRGAAPRSRPWTGPHSWTGRRSSTGRASEGVDDRPGVPPEVAVLGGPERDVRITVRVTAEAVTVSLLHRADGTRDADDTVRRLSRALPRLLRRATRWHAEHTPHRSARPDGGD